MREDVSCEGRAVEGRTAADIPKYAGTCTCIDYVNCRGGRGDERARYLENPYRIEVTPAVESERPRQIKSGNRIDARSEPGKARRNESSQVRRQRGTGPK